MKTKIPSSAQTRITSMELKLTTFTTLDNWRNSMIEEGIMPSSVAYKRMVEDLIESSPAENILRQKHGLPPRKDKREGK